MKTILNFGKAALVFIACMMTLSAATHVGDSYWLLFEKGIEKMYDYILEKCNK